MGHAIVRLFARDWAATLSAIADQGDRFYWNELDDRGERLPGRLPFIVEYEAPPAFESGARERAVGETYQDLRLQLAEPERAVCDACFAPLFWDDEEESRHRDLTVPSSIQDLWNVLAPPTVHRLGRQLAVLPWKDLELAATSALGSRGSSFEELYEQVRHYRRWLAEAEKTGAGLLALVSQ